jgi:hypothetical protein
MSNTPQQPPSDAPPGAPHPPSHPPAGSFTPAPQFTPAAPPQPAYTPPGGTQQGFTPAQPPPGFQASPAPPLAAPSPVPPASQVPLPPRPSFAPSRNPIVRLILWFTEPSMLKGMAMGVILALVVGVAIRLEAMWYIISGLLLILFVCLFGVIIGHYVFENRRKRVQAKGLEMLREAGQELPALSDNIVTMLWSRDRSQLPAVWDRLRRIRPAVEEIGGLTFAVVFRTMAMSALFAVLGAAISFAVFITSFMQVERMTEQNKLINQQIDDAKKQMEFEKNAQDVAVALSISDRRQVTLRDLISDVSSDLAGKGGPCGADVPPTRFGQRKRCLSDGAARQIATFIPLLRPYRPVVPADDGGNTIDKFPSSPEQHQFLHYLSANHIEVGVEALGLSRTFLDKADLSWASLERIHLQGVSMQGVVLADTELSNADLSGAILTNAHAPRAKLGQANLSTAKLHKADLSGADLTGANLAKAELHGAILKSAVLQQAQLGSAELHGANLAGANLTGADLTETDLALANLDGATLPQIPKVRAAAFWWLGIYSSDYAGKLGLGPDAQQRNQAAYDRLLAAPDADAAKAIVQELKHAAPNAPA